MNKKIKELEEKIIAARKAYYNGSDIMTDQAFDALVDELFELDPKNLVAFGIGSEPVSNWEKYQHLEPMGSLNKCQTHEEFLHWSNKYCRDEKFFLTLKLDGLSVSLIYENGFLVKAATRGGYANGISIGELITPNVVKMGKVPLRLKEKINVTVRGEIVLSKKNHKEFFPDYSNPRNAASGISRRYDGEGCDKLDVLAHDLIISDDIAKKYDVADQDNKFGFLIDLGFEVPVFQLCETDKEVLEVKTRWQEKGRDKFPYDLDGLVISNNSLEKLDQFGSNHGRKYGMIAYKFDAVHKEATISDIVLQTGNSGRITPVAIFNPKVHLSGADVERASLHNFSNIKELGVGIGCKVLVCRSNDVIPTIKEVVEFPKEIFETPTHCPECDHLVEENGEYIQCPNMECPARLVGKLQNWITELKIDEWGSKLLERLVENGKVNTISDLYDLTIDDLCSIERMGEKSATKCFDILHANKTIPLEIFLGGLSIPLVGTSTIKTIMAAGYPDLTAIQKMTIEQMEAVNGIGPQKAASLYKGLKDNKELIQKLLEQGITIKMQNAKGKLTGMFICITGSTNIKRSDLEKMIETNGGVFKSSVSKDTTHLVIADINSQSSKAVKARKQGIILMSEAELLDVINNNLVF